MSDLYLPAIRIRGYRSFRDVLFRLNRLEVIIGANGSGKSSLFSFLRFLRDSCIHEIPPEIIPGAVGQHFFHKPGGDQFFWNVHIDYKDQYLIFYQGEVAEGDRGPEVQFERILTKKPIDDTAQGGFTFLDFKSGKGLVRDPQDRDFLRKEWDIGRPNQLGLGAITDANLPILFELRNYIQGWRFYSGTRVNSEKMRQPVPVAWTPILDEDCGNLSAVLYNLMNDFPEAFEDLKSLIQFAIPGFKSLDVRKLGESNEVMAFWQEDGVETELSFADLADGILRFIAWATLCIIPTPPPLICIDDPGQGLHPRTMPVLAGLFEKASERTQVLLTTHASYFLTQFDLENISLIKKSAGGSVFVNVRNAQALMSQLQKVETEEMEQMYRADELEALF